MSHKLLRMNLFRLSHREAQFDQRIARVLQRFSTRKPSGTRSLSYTVNVYVTGYERDCWCNQTEQIALKYLGSEVAAA